MKKRIGTILICILLIFSSLVVVYPIKAMIVSSDTLYVGGSGPGNYTTIQDAIKNASNGDTVFVYNGTYYLNIDLFKSIKLIGENKNSTIIDGKNKTCIILNRYGIAISGFTFINYKGDTVEIIGNPSSNCLIDDCIFYSGIFFWGGNYITISNNIFYSKCGYGMEIMDDLFGEISFNTIIGTNESIGIFLKGTHYKNYKSIVKNNNIKYSKVGILIENSENDNISNNSISNSDQGIRLRFNSNSTIESNQLLENRIGISLFACNNIVIKKNIVTSCTEDAIWIFGSTENQVLLNKIINNKRIGIFFDTSNDNIVSKNTFIDNKYDAYFYACRNTWNNNYWNRPRFLPKIIFGNRDYSKLGIQLDRYPAKEPYNIT